MLGWLPDGRGGGAVRVRGRGLAARLHPAPRVRLRRAPHRHAASRARQGLAARLPGPHHRHRDTGTKSLPFIIRPKLTHSPAICEKVIKTISPSPPQTA